MSQTPVSRSTNGVRPAFSRFEHSHGCTYRSAIAGALTGRAADRHGFSAWTDHPSSRADGRDLGNDRCGSRRPPALPRIDEVTATRRMILAHAPFRDPKVADPDSVENRHVLQTMVAKALARAKNQP